MANPVIIDISHYQDGPDWPKLKANGTVGVILKATEGTSYIDNTYVARKKAALAAGLTVSSYHFFHDGNPQQQMAHFLATVKPVPGERMVIDHEGDATLDEVKEAVKYLLDKGPGVQVTLYSGHTIKDQLGSKKDDYLAANTSLWIAHYTTASAPSWPTGTWPAWSLWQYTDKASVIGIDGPVDGNKFNGTKDAAIKWMGPTAPEPAPTPEPEAAVVTVTIDAPDGVEVKVVVNGNIIG